MTLYYYPRHRAISKLSVDNSDWTKQGIKYSHIKTYQMNQGPDINPTPCAVYATDQFQRINHDTYEMKRRIAVAVVVVESIPPRLNGRNITPHCYHRDPHNLEVDEEPTGFLAVAVAAGSKYPLELYLASIYGPLTPPPPPACPCTCVWICGIEFAELDLPPLCNLALNLSCAEGALSNDFLGGAPTPASTPA